jgi:hypothetical protein
LIMVFRGLSGELDSKSVEGNLVRVQLSPRASHQPSPWLALFPEQQSQVAEGGPIHVVAGAEGRKRILPKEAPQAVGDGHVVGGEHATCGQVGKNGLELPRHMLEGMQAVVMEEINEWESIDQSRKLATAVTDNQLPLGLQLAQHEEIMGWLV